MTHHTCSHVTRRSALLGGAGVAALGFASGNAASADTPDPAYPRFGDARYTVKHYDIDNTLLTGSSPRLSGSTTMTCVAKDAMTSLFVDFQHTPDVVWINGKRVSCTAAGIVGTTYGDHADHRRFTVSGFSLAAGATFTIKVGYDVVANTNGTGSLSSSGAYFVVAGQPIAATHWFPCNDRLDVKSTYGISISTQRTNQVLLAKPTSQVAFTSTSGAAMTTVRFAVTEPSATYQLGLAVGPFSVSSGTWKIGDRNVPFRVAAQAGLSKSVLLDHTPRALGYFAARYGSFPFAQAGGVLVSELAVGAQETIGGPTYASYCNSVAFVAHENAHMWFGNSVSASSWDDVVLIHEGLATLLEWDYLVAHGFDQSLVWGDIVAAPSGSRVPKYMGVTRDAYGNAAGIMRQLRLTMDGSIYQANAPRFTRFLATLASTHAHSSITRAQFKAEAQNAAGSGKDLNAFWRRYGI